MRPLVIASLALVSLAAPALAEDIVLDRTKAPIKAVTVYATQALVRREAAFEAQGGGMVRVVLARLPARIKDDSVRVRAEQGLTLLGSRIVARPVAESSLP